MVLGGHHAPITRVRAQHPQNFWDLLHACTLMRNNNQILHGDQTRCEEFYRMLTCDVLAVAKLLVVFVRRKISFL